MSCLQLMLSLFFLLNHQMCFKLPLQDCWTANYDILMSLDCRDEISYQYEIYSSLHKYFSSNTLNRISLITYNMRYSRVIKTFNESFSDDHQSRIYDKKFECPSEFSYSDIFLNIKEGFGLGRKRAKKLAFIIILANFKSPQIDYYFVETESITQINYKGIIRIFIIINMYNNFNQNVNDVFIYDTQLKMSKIPLIKYLGTLCSGCSSDQISFISSEKHNKKCYSLGNSIVKRSMVDAMSECKGVFDLIDFDSKEEFNFVRSILINQLVRLQIFRAAVVINQNAHKPNYLEPMGTNTRTINPNKDLCTVLLFKHTLAEARDISVIGNRSYIKATRFTDQWLSEACDEKIDILKLCEVDLTLYKIIKSHPLVFELAYTKVKVGEPTLLPKNYFHDFLQDNKIYDGNLYNIGKTTYVPINCPVDDIHDFLCQHIVKCHSDENYRRSFCNAPVQYIYKHSLLTEYYNYQVVNISGQHINRQRNILNRLNDTHKNVQPNIKMLKESIFQLQDYNFSKKIAIVSCNHFYEENVRKLNLSQKDNFTPLENNNILFDSDTNRPQCFFSRSVAEQSPAFENYINCSEVVCPANFIKCPSSYCVFLGEELSNKNLKCYSLESAESDLSKYFHCSVRLKSTIKRTCLSDDAPYIDQPLYKAYVCDFPCENGFKCIQWHKETVIENATVYKYKVFEKRIDILNFNDNYKIHPEEIPFLSLLDHAEILAPDCKIRNVHHFFQDLDISHLFSVDLSYNEIFESLHLDGIGSLRLLRYLNLSHNVNFNIKKEINFPIYLESIDLSYTKVVSIPSATFDKLVYLKYLYLSYTKIIYFKSIGLKPYCDLKVLDLRGILLRQIKTNYFENLTIQTSLFVSDYKFCCPQVTGRRVPQHKCFSPKAPHLSSCEDLIGDSYKRMILWLVGLVAFVSNLIVVVYRLVWDKGTLKKSYGIFVTCLGVSDLIMGLYLLVIAAADSYFRSIYVLNDTKWRSGNICKFAGFLALFSSESSAFFICLITIDRYLIMRYPFGEHSFSKKGEKCALILTWFVSFILALIPTFPLDWDIYSTNSMCLSLPLNNITNKGWKYSFCVLVILNFLTFLFIFIGQISVFGWFAKNKFPDGSMIKKTRNIDFALAKNLAFVAISDFLCWFPIAIMGLISLSGYKFGNEAYSWSAVLVIPINSALNPIIYTVPTITRKLRTMHCFK